MRTRFAVLPSIARTKETKTVTRRQKLPDLLEPVDFDRIAGDFNCDKGEPGHRYGVIYADVLNDLRLLQHTYVFEIGVDNGNSLRLWEWLLPNSTITALDNKPRCKRHQTPRSRVIIGDQANPVILRKIVHDHGPFHLVIDDGSHFARHQILTFKTLWPTMKRQTYYVCEDLQPSALEKNGTAVFFGQALQHLATMPIGEQPHTLTAAAGIVAFHVN